MIKSIFSAALCALLVACGGGEPVIASAEFASPAITPIWAGAGEVVVARAEIVCPRACVIDVDQQSSIVWTASDTGKTITVSAEIVKVGQKRLAGSAAVITLMDSGGPGPWNSAIGMQRQFVGAAGEVVALEYRIALDQPARLLAVAAARMSAVAVEQ